jgi:hypothetical protein
MRLKRYIQTEAAGLCHSHKELLNVLSAELEALGIKDNPSLEKC